MASITKQVRLAVDDTHRADDRAAAAAKLAQDASNAVQRLESANTRRPDVESLKNFREQLESTATEIRLDAKKGMDALGREIESTAAELRGTISSLVLQVECGVSGHTSALADAVDTAAQKHVDYLEWLRTLDAHKGQLERQQSELEQLLSAMLSAQKVSLEADIEAMSLRVTQQQSKIALLDNGFTRANSGVEGVRATVSALDSLLKARAVEWDGFTDSIRDRMGSLQAGIAENKWGMVTIAGAISTIANPEASLSEIASPSRCSHEAESQLLRLEG